MFFFAFELSAVSNKAQSKYVLQAKTVRNLNFLSIFSEWRAIVDEAIDDLKNKLAQICDEITEEIFSNEIRHLSVPNRL